MSKSKAENGGQKSASLIIKPDTYLPLAYAYDEGMSEHEKERVNAATKKQRKAADAAADELREMLAEKLSISKIIGVKANGAKAVINWSGNGRLYIRRGSVDNPAKFTKLKKGKKQDDSAVEPSESMTTELDTEEGYAFTFLLDFIIRPAVYAAQAQEDIKKQLKALKKRPATIEEVARKTWQPTFTEDTTVDGVEHEMGDEDYRRARMFTAKLRMGNSKKDDKKKDDDDDTNKGKAKRVIDDGGSTRQMWCTFHFFDPDNPEFDDNPEKGVERLRSCASTGIADYIVEEVFYSGGRDVLPDMKVKLSEYVCLSILPPAGTKSMFDREELADIKKRQAAAKKERSIEQRRKKSTTDDSDDDDKKKDSTKTKKAKDSDDESIDDKKKKSKNKKKTDDSDAESEDDKKKKKTQNTKKKVKPATSDDDE